MAGLIAMVSVLVVVGIEMFFATRGAGHMHGSEYDAPEEQGPGRHIVLSSGHANPTRRRADTLRPFREADRGANTRADERFPLRTMNGPTDNILSGPSTPQMHHKPRTPVGSARRYDDPENPLDLDDELDETADTTRNNGYSNDSAQLSDQQLQQKMLLQCLLLEAGILFHSVFIGMALSVSVGPPFVVLLIAISFHQTFEGLALGSRIAAITSFPPSSPKPWLMALAYGTTTPIGQAIGLGVHNLYDPAGEAGLLMVGIMNAISSGLLLFAGLVELLAEDFLSDRSYEILRGRRRLEACAAVVAGSMLMALVGAWA